MVVAKLPSGGLMLHSVVALNDAELAKMLAIGTPEYMIVPNPLHRLDASVYAERFPKMKVLCPKDAVEKVKKKVRVDGTCEDVLPTIGIAFHTVPGIKSTELVYEFGSKENKVAVFCDALMNLPDLPGFDGKLMKWLGSTGFFGMTKIGKMLLLKNKNQYADWLKAQAKRTDIKAISVAHGAAVVTAPALHFQRAAERL
jgi:hypothetical protein